MKKRKPQKQEQQQEEKLMLNADRFYTNKNHCTLITTSLSVNTSLNPSHISLTLS